MLYYNSFLEEPDHQRHLQQSLGHESQTQKFIYRIDKAPPIIQKVLDELGWVQFDEKTHQANQWNLWWKAARQESQMINGFRPSVSEYQAGLTHQRFVHFPKTSLICTKDNLCRQLRKMKVSINIISIFRTFLVPSTTSLH
ncbi:hypothetical protein FGO68_gene14202 [Halteria grandinella]|uniref:Uncharacterized protein n=1 Tax=Halteria grandinella TaxID=5974 RepID=A0A8J8NBW3_HALGN|nr:hypothetical protein FGO68_gene14202 [Halteria grandinella]